MLHYKKGLLLISTNPNPEFGSVVKKPVNTIVAMKKAVLLLIQG